MHYVGADESRTCHMSLYLNQLKRDSHFQLNIQRNKRENFKLLYYVDNLMTLASLDYDNESRRFYLIKAIMQVDYSERLQCRLFYANHQTRGNETEFYAMQIDYNSNSLARTLRSECCSFRKLVPTYKVKFASPNAMDR